MLLNLIVVLGYFVLVLGLALSGRGGQGISAEEFYLSGRRLRWPSIAISTIATNVQGYQFLGMMGSAYLYGLAQANLEINAVNGLWLAAFVFVPLYLKDRVITITQFIEKRLGKPVALAYSLANIALFSTMGLGAALFWGGYAADMVFGNLLQFLGDDQFTRIVWLIVILGVISAIYTYHGGLSAVVRTDLLQFAILVGGGLAVLFVAVHHLGGWGALYEKTPDLMHLHLPADHPQLPWIAIAGMFILNVNYWCANQYVMQRSLAAKNLREAQIGLMVGGVMKYAMGVIIIVPGIALAGILADNPLVDPDQAFPYLVTTYIPAGLSGLILCALFASLMSTVDSLFNSLATLWSVDIYKGYLRKEATDNEMIRSARMAIGVTLLTGIGMGIVLLYVKLNNPEAAFTHTLNELRYYINCGIVVVISGAAFLAWPNQRMALIAFLITIPLHLTIIGLFPDMNYFVRAMWVILLAFGLLAAVSIKGGWSRGLYQPATRPIGLIGWGLLLSLAGLHWAFH